MTSESVVPLVSENRKTEQLTFTSHPTAAPER